MNPSKIILQTKRLTLRRIQQSDVPPLLDLWTDPEVTEHLGGPRERAKLEPLFAQDVQDPFAEEYDLWPVEERQTREVIGHCGLLEKEVDGADEIEVIYIFKRLAWGKGYATEIGKALIQYAFEDKKQTRVIALIEPENEASAAVAEKIGMLCEKEVIRPGGEPRKVYVVEKHT